MSGPTGAAVVAVAMADQTGLRSSTGIHATWQGLGLDPVAGRVRLEPIFGRGFRSFRRLELYSRMLVVLAEALDLPAHLGEAERTATALVAGSETGCLTADRRFEASLHTAAGIEPAVFPYTLPSTPLGEIAIRHRLRGPTVFLSIAAGEETLPVATAEDLLNTGEAAAAVVLIGDWVPSPGVSGDHKTRATALLLRPWDADTPNLARSSDFSAGPAPFPGIDACLSPWKN